MQTNLDIERAGLELTHTFSVITTYL